MFPHTASRDETKVHVSQKMPKCLKWKVSPVCACACLHIQQPGPHTLPCPPSPLPRRCGQWQGRAREGVPEHHMHPSVPRAHDFEASRISNKLMKLPIPAAVPHVTTTESSRYISPVSISIDAKLDRNVPQHRRYPSNVRAQDFVQSKSCSEPNVTVATQTSNFAVPQPCAATFTTTTTTATTTTTTTTTTTATTTTMTTIKYYYTT